MKTVFAKGERHSLDHRIVWPDGSVRWVHAEAVAKIADDGKVQSFSGTCKTSASAKKLNKS